MSQHYIGFAARLRRLERRIQGQPVVNVVLTTPWRQSTAPVRTAEAKAPAPRRVKRKATKK
jgi:hypothetical protein